MLGTANSCTFSYTFHKQGPTSTTFPQPWKKLLLQNGSDLAQGVAQQSQIVER
jgi:hypothetical protein